MHFSVFSTKKENCPSNSYFSNSFMINQLRKTIGFSLSTLYFKLDMLHLFLPLNNDSGP